MAAFTLPGSLTPELCEISIGLVWVAQAAGLGRMEPYQHRLQDWDECSHSSSQPIELDPTLTLTSTVADSDSTLEKGRSYERGSHP